MAPFPSRFVTGLFAGIFLTCALAWLQPLPAEAKTTTLTLAPLEPEEEGSAEAQKPARQETTWRLSADTLNSLADNTIIEASGAVELRTEGCELRADFARYYAETGWVYLKGNAFIKMDDDTITAAEAEFDLRGQTGWMYKGNVFMAGPHMYVSGDSIIKHSGSHYSFEQAKITTCDGDAPAWSVSSQTATVEIDGYARLYGASVAIKNIDVAYAPFLLLPAKVTRQAGLLPPDVGYSKKRGVYYTQPFYWPIDDVSDVTFYASYMARIGGGVGVEYRSMPTTRQKTWLAFTAISDRRSEMERQGNRTNNGRYWLRGMGNGDLGDTGWQYKFDLDYVSDQFFLRNFSDGPMGFDASYDALYGMFRRTLREENRTRVSQALLFRDWDRFGLTASTRYEQNPIYGHDGRSRSLDTQLQQLPQIGAFLYKGEIVPGFPLEAEAQFTSGYMYRRAGTSGMRTEIEPRLSLPIDLKYLSIIPSVGVHQTWYSNTHIDRSKRYQHSTVLATNPRLNGSGRTVPEIDIHGFTELNRVWHLDNAPADRAAGKPGFFDGWVGLKHDIQPRLRYHYIRDVDQYDNPYYTEADRLFPVNELTYSITNILTRKRAIRNKRGAKPASAPLAAEMPPRDLDRHQLRTGENALPESDAPVLQQDTPALQQEGPAKDVAYDYLELLRWKLEWGYDFNEARRNTYLDQYQRRPMTDILSEIAMQPLPWFRATSRTYFSPYTGRLTRHDHSLTFVVSNWLTWTTGLEYRDDDYKLRERLRYASLTGLSRTTPAHLFKNTFKFNLHPHWAVSYYDARNLRRPDGAGLRGKGYDKGLLAVYTDQCYQLFFRFSDNGYDKSYSVMFQIPGVFTR